MNRLAPSPKLIAATALSFIALVGALIIYLATLIASGHGIDPGPAADAAKTVIEATK